MSSDIEKLAVFDGRIVQSRPKFAVDKGALSLTNAPFNAIAATASQHTYNVYVPSENVFVDRKLLWSSTCAMSATITNTTGAAIPQYTPLFSPGLHWGLAAFPLNSLCSTVSATINDTTAVINTQDVLKEVLRLADYKKNRQVRTCPTMLDKYQSNNDAYSCNNNPYAGYNNASDVDNIPNGAFNGLVFTDQAGAVLPEAYTNAAVAATGTNATAYAALRGVPVAPNGGLANNAVYTIYFRFSSTESLVLSPFVFADEYEWDTGLFGVNNIQLIMNLQSSPANIVRWNNRYANIAVSNIQYYTNTQGVGPFTNSKLNVQFLTPSLDVPLPPKSVVPYLEFPRYITQPAGVIAPGATAQLSSQTITLPCIPDLLIIYVKPSAKLATDGDFYLPLTSFITGGAANPVSFNFDNFSGLLSSVSTEQLYNMSCHNGLDMDFQQWSGLSRSTANATVAIGQAGGELIPTTGSILVLKPGVDLTLQSGQAASLVGNFTLQFQLNVLNNTAQNQTPQIYVITANSGFFETIRGSSRIIKGVLSEQDIISAPLAPMVVRSELDRMVGEGRSFGKFGNALSKMRDFYSKTKGVGTAVRGLLPDSGNFGVAKAVMGKLGYGEDGGSGAGSSGAGRRRKNLSERLM